MNLVRKYLSYLIFGGVVLLVVGLALRHSGHLRSLLNDMSSSSPEAQKSAAAQLIADEQFMDSITGEPTATRVKAAEALEALGNDKAVKQCLPLLKDQEKLVRDRAVLTLKKIAGTSPANIKELVNGLTEGDANGRKGLKSVMTDADGIGPKPEVITAVIDKMKADANARTVGSDVLSSPSFVSGGAKQSVPALIALLKDKDEGIRSSAAETLGKIGDSSATAPLKEALKDTPQVRRIAIGAIALIADPAGEETLQEALSNPDDDNEARAQAAVGLGKIATPSAVTTLIKALDDDDLKIRSAAITALSRAARPQPNGPVAIAPLNALTTALRTGSDTARQGAALALQTVGAKEANTALLSVLSDQSATVELRANVALALGFADNSAAVAPLIQQLSDPSGEVNTAARDALGAIGPAATTALLAVMQKGSTEAYYAAQALAKHGESALTALEQAAQKSNPTAQRWAAVALGDLGQPDKTRPILQTLEKSSDPDVAYTAKQQLDRMGRVQ